MSENIENQDLEVQECVEQSHNEAEPHSYPSCWKFGTAMLSMPLMIPSKSLDKLSDSGEQAEEVHNAFSLSPPPKKRMITTPWTAVEEQRLKAMRDTGKSWGEISKIFSGRTEGSIKKHWYKDMHYADFAEDDSAALLVAIEEDEFGKSAKVNQACQPYAKDVFREKGVALQDVYHADFAEDDVSFAHVMPDSNKRASLYPDSTSSEELIEYSQDSLFHEGDEIFLSSPSRGPNTNELRNDFRDGDPGRVVHSEKNAFGEKASETLTKTLRLSEAVTTQPGLRDDHILRLTKAPDATNIEDGDSPETENNLLLEHPGDLQASAGIVEHTVSLDGSGWDGPWFVPQETQVPPGKKLEKSVLSSIPMSGYGGDGANPRSPPTEQHKCPYCSVEFVEHDNLKSHLLTHSNEKPYQCDTCEARFRASKDLKRHTKLHTGEGRHVCPRCNRSFARGSALKSHNAQCRGIKSGMSSIDSEEKCAKTVRADDGNRKAQQEPRRRRVEEHEAREPAKILEQFRQVLETKRGLKQNSMRAVESLVLDVLAGSTIGTASLAMKWDLLGFMESQYPDNDKAMLGSVITLTGSALCAQAMTCSEYVRQTWPLTGTTVLTAFEHAIDSYRQKVKGTSTGTDINVHLIQGGCVLEVTSERKWFIAETFQVAVWIGAALQISKNERVQYSTFFMDSPGAQVRGPNKRFSVRFSTSDLSAGEQSCWLPLFSNPVIARGFPVRQRENEEKGLDIPLEIMAALGGARHITEFEGGLVLKGYSAMFVPVKRHKQSIQWHLIRRNDEERILYRDLVNEYQDRVMLEEVDQSLVQTTRAFLGWWKCAETHLGTADAAYSNIGWSPAGEAKRYARLSGANIGFQTMITGQLSFIMGKKDGRLHFSQKGPFQRIVQCAESIPVALYDQEDRRAWFVPALNVMLHILRTRHHMSPYKIDREVVDLSPVDPGRYKCAAAEAIAINQSRLLYAGYFSEKDYYFEDAILDIWSQMERLMEKEDSIEASYSGLALHGTLQSKLYGWEFMSLVHEKNFRRKEVTIEKSSGGWVDLINDIDGLVLFATGFGEIIRPVSKLDSLCRGWRSLPTGKDYLAADVPILELLYSEAGSRLSRKHLSSSHLQWHRGSTLFEECSGTTTHRCDCDRTQQIYHDSLFKTFGRVKPPGKLEENGCVIFGQARHPFKPAKILAVRENAVHMLPNNSIQNAGIVKKISEKDDGITSPSPPASFSPECRDIKFYEIANLKRPLSPQSLSDNIAQAEALLPKRRRNDPHSQKTSFDTCMGPSSGNDQNSIPDDYAVCPAEYQSTLKHNTQSKGTCLASTQTACASEAQCAPVHARKTIRRKAKMEDYNHRHGCSCGTCSIVDFEPSDSIELRNTTNGTRRSSTTIVERRERQQV